MSVNLMSAIFETEFFDIKDEGGNVTKAATAKIVLLAMADHANDEGEGSYPSIDRLCRKTALSAQTIRNTFDALRFNGIIALEGISKHGTNNHTINTRAFPKAMGKEVTHLTLYPLDPPLTGGENPSNRSLDPNYSLDPNHITIIESSVTDANKKVDAILEAERQAQQIKDILSYFEKQFGFSALPWNGKPEWEKFGKWVVKLFREDGQSFNDYVSWRRHDGKYQAMSNNKIRQNPQMFMDTGWPTFLAHTAMYGDKQKEPEIKPLPADPNEGNYVPAPDNPRRRTS